MLIEALSGSYDDAQAVFFAGISEDDREQVCHTIIFRLFGNYYPPQEDILKLHFLTWLLRLHVRSRACARTFQGLPCPVTPALECRGRARIPPSRHVATL